MIWRGCSIRTSRLDQLLRPFLQVGTVPNPAADRRLPDPRWSRHKYKRHRARTRGHGNGLLGSSAPTQLSLPIGACCMSPAEHREPYEPRGSRTDLGARGGEIPLRDSPHSRKHAGFAAPRHRSSRRYPGSRRRHPAACNPVRDVSFLEDAAYQGPGFHKVWAKVLPHLETEIVRRSDHAKGFVVLPKRWIVERTIAWLNRCRRLAKDWGDLNRKGLAFLRLASVRLMLRKLCNPA
jgi:transposase